MAYRDFVGSAPPFTTINDDFIDGNHFAVNEANNYNRDVVSDVNYNFSRSSNQSIPFSQQETIIHGNNYCKPIAFIPQQTTILPPIQHHTHPMTFNNPLQHQQIANQWSYDINDPIHSQPHINMNNGIQTLHSTALSDTQVTVPSQQRQIICNNMCFQQERIKQQLINQSKKAVKTKESGKIQTRSTIFQNVMERIGAPVPQYVIDNIQTETATKLDAEIDSWTGVDESKTNINKKKTSKQKQIKKRRKEPKTPKQEYIETALSHFCRKSFKWNAKYWLMIITYINETIPSEYERIPLVASILRAKVKLVIKQRYLPWIAAITLACTEEVEEAPELRKALDISFSNRLHIADLYQPKIGANTYLQKVLGEINTIIPVPLTKEIPIGKSKIKWPKNYHNLCVLPREPSTATFPSATSLHSLEEETDLKTNSVDDTTDSLIIPTVCLSPPLDTFLPLSSSPIDPYAATHSATNSVIQQRYLPTNHASTLSIPTFNGY